MSFLFPSSTITLEAALRDVSSSSVKARLRAVQALGNLDDLTERRRAVAALSLALEDDQAQVRAEATASLAQMAELAPVGALIARLADGDPTVRQHAAIALGTLRDRAGYAPLLEALRDGPAELRYQAVTSLAEIDPLAAYQPLVEALTDRDAQVAAAAAVALGTIGDGRAVLHLVPALGHAEAEVRFEAAWALAELGDPRGRAELVAQLGLPPPGTVVNKRAPLPPAATHPGRAIEAVEALAQLGALEDRQALVRYLDVRSAPPEAAIIAARCVLLLLDDGLADRSEADLADRAATPSAATPEHDAADRAAAERVLLAALTARKDPLRGLAVEQLAEVGGAWATPALTKLRASRRGRLLAEPIDDALAAIAARAAGTAPRPPAPSSSE